VRHRLATLALIAVAAGACSSHRPPALAVAPAKGTTVVGIASWYGGEYDGRKTSSGERYDQDGLTAAHADWAFGTRVKVTLLSTGKSVVVKINDRLPRKDRIIDLSRGAAQRIGLIGPGTGKVRLEVIG
jgi:rare lipoprotein A